MHAIQDYNSNGSIPLQININIPPMFVDEDDDLLQKFYTDAVNSVVFNTPVAYLQKYDKIEDYQTIVDSEEEILRLLFIVVSREIEKPSKISELLSQEGVNERINPILSLIISNKIADIKRELLRREICRGSPCLLDNNWRIINVISSNWSAHTNKVLLNLTLIIEQKHSFAEEEKRICLELNIHEVEQLLNKLKEIKRALKL